MYILHKNKINRDPLESILGVGVAPRVAEAESPHLSSPPSLNFQQLVVFILLIQNLIPLLPWGMEAFLPSPRLVVVER